MFKLSCGESDYPPDLLTISDPPPCLWGKGEIPLLHEAVRVAVVGTREPTAYGRRTAFRLARGLAEQGIVVVSGLAYGIDTEAHEGALAGGGKTIAVLGCGLDFPYPKKNLDLKERIGGQGVVVTEFPPEIGSNPIHFPQRNRIISGLSQAVVVIEAGQKSGALNTAQWALKQGKEVLAVPGNIDSPSSAGTNRLIAEGATPLTALRDIFDILKLPLDSPRQLSLQEDVPEEPVLRILGEGKKTVDELVEESGLSPAQVSTRLLALEMEGKVRQSPGGWFEKNG